MCREEVGSMIPSYEDLMLPMLKFLSDGREHPMKEVEDYLADQFNVTEAERLQRYETSGAPIFKARTSWARTYMFKAKLIDVPRRGYVIITDRGREVLTQNRQRLDHKFLEQYPEFQDFRSRSKRGKSKKTIIDVEPKNQTPEEQISENLDQLNQALKDDLLRRVLGLSPASFKNLVIDLIVKMGYGGSVEEVSQRLGGTGDEGVDGVIKEDVLGLDNVYIQAKRWTQESIGRPAVQAFVGALTGKGAKKGIFITTTTFTKDALDFIEGLKDPKVILIDRDKLLDYMIRYNVGVHVERTLEIKKIDEDYFLEN